MFTEKQLAEILEVCEKLPKGPWEWVEDKFHGGYSGLVDAENKEVLFPNCCNDGDEGAAWFEDYATPEVRHFITLARTALPQLAQRVIELEGQVDPYWMNKAQELEEENAKLRAVAEAAEEIEWVYGGDNPEGMWLYCPCCGKGEVDGHSADCKLHIALAAAGYGGEE
jgi:hypothetical protein